MFILAKYYTFYMDKETFSENCKASQRILVTVIQKVSHEFLISVRIRAIEKLI